jgi:hypothetical protein
MSSAHAFVCNQNEAQFIGVVKELRTISDIGGRDCFFKIDFSYFHQNILCPIDDSIINSNEVIDFDCSRNFENGQEISGVLIEKSSTLYIEE